MKTKKIYNAPKCRPIEIGNESMLMTSGDAPARMINRTERMSQRSGGWDNDEDE